jgi:hypothetical protein
MIDGERRHDVWSLVVCCLLTPILVDIPFYYTVASTMDDARPTLWKVASVLLAIPVSNANSESKTPTTSKMTTTMITFSKKIKSKTVVTIWSAFMVASASCRPI